MVRKVVVVVEVVVCVCVCVCVRVWVSESWNSREYTAFRTANFLSLKLKKKKRWQNCTVLTARDMKLSHDCQAKTEGFGRRLHPLPPTQTPYCEWLLHFSAMVIFHKTWYRIQSQQTAKFPASIKYLPPPITRLLLAEKQLDKWAISEASFSRHIFNFRPLKVPISHIN